MAKGKKVIKGLAVLGLLAGAAYSFIKGKKEDISREEIEDRCCDRCDKEEEAEE